VVQKRTLADTSTAQQLSREDGHAPEEGDSADTCGKCILSEHGVYGSADADIVVVVDPFDGSTMFKRMCPPSGWPQWSVLDSVVAVFDEDGANSSSNPEPRSSQRHATGSRGDYARSNFR